MSLPFSLFASLLGNVQKCNLLKARSHLGQPKATPYDIFERWVKYLRNEYPSLPSQTTRTLFRLLFPEEDSQHKYDLKEKRLISLLVECYSTRVELLSQWNHESSIGCLGTQLYELLLPGYVDNGNSGNSLDIFQVDQLLDELASLSNYTHQTVRTQHPTPRSRSEIVRSLFRHASPLEACVLTQIILKDLRPMMSNISTLSYTTALLEYNSNAIKYLTKEDAMRIWDPSGKMLRLFRVLASLDDVALAFVNGEAEPHPVVGKPVKIPKCIKGQGVHHALRHFKRTSRVWVETKYDGERCQIHVQVLPHHQSCINIFSKSLRESTWDRAGVHDIVRRALGLQEGGTPRIRCNAVLEAEMVAHTGDKIDEFWRIRALVASTAVGVRRRSLAVTDPDRSQPSMASDYDVEARHLALVFFDILILDSESYLCSSYRERRQVLENTIIQRPGFAMLADRKHIDLDWQQGLKSACRALDDHFSELVAECEEGVILKSDEGEYNQYGNPWIKLKRDYIPGLGDSVDFVALGCTWDPDRGRELGVPPSVATTLYVGGLENAKAMKNDPDQKPHFHIYFTVSYGLTREQLEDCNFYIRHLGRILFKSVSTKTVFGYTFSILSTLPKPTYMFEQPLLLELMGAGFSKAPQSTHYELRFPRIQKIYRRSERSWKDALSLEDIHTLALNTVGRDSSTKQARDEINRIWGNPVSPGSKCFERKRKLKREWESKLALADGRSPKKHTTSTSSPLKLMTPLESRSRSLSILTPRTPTHRQRRIRKEFSSPVYNTPVRNQLPLTSPPPSTPVSSPIISSSAIIFTQQTGANFLATAFVFVAQHPSQAAETVVPTAICDMQRLHTLDALLFGCGWFSSAGFVGCDWIDKGVIFLDKKDTAWQMYINHVLDEGSQKQTAGRKPIYVFDISDLKGCFLSDTTTPIVEPLCVYE